MPKVYLRNSVPVAKAKEYVDDYEITPEYSYIFDENTYKGGGIPQVNLLEIDLKPFDVLGQNVIPIEYKHGPTTVYGFRISDFAYLTDCNYIPESEFPKLEGLKVLIIDALRYRKHETHYSVDEAIAVSHRINAVKTYFTHMTHDIVHAEASSKLPANIEFAYDGLSLEV